MILISGLSYYNSIIVLEKTKQIIASSIDDVTKHYSIIMDKTPDPLVKEAVTNFLYSDNAENKPILLNCDIQTSSLKCEYIINKLVDICNNSNLCRENMSTWVTDSARYFISSRKLMKIMFKNSIHIVDGAHNIHNILQKVFQHDVLSPIMKLLHFESNYFGWSKLKDLNFVIFKIL